MAVTGVLTDTDEVWDSPTNKGLWEIPATCPFQNTLVKVDSVFIDWSFLEIIQATIRSSTATREFRGGLPSLGQTL